MGDCNYTVSWSDNTTTCSGTLIPYGISSPWEYDYVNADHKEIKKEDKMRSLYDVYVVDPRKQGKVIGSVLGIIIADNQEQALLKANVAKIAEDAGLELEQVDVYARIIGDFIRPRKDTQRVKIVREKDEE